MDLNRRHEHEGCGQAEPQRCVLIDATTSKDEVADQIWRVVQKKLDPATAPIQFEDEAASA